MFLTYFGYRMRVTRAIFSKKPGVFARLAHTRGTAAWAWVYRAGAVGLLRHGGLEREDLEHDAAATEIFVLANDCGVTA